jgi:glucose-6-phosphate isomerase
MSELFSAELEATRQALIASQRPVITVRFPRVNEWTVGQFIYVYEVATTIMGLLLGVNPYDQPGVELGKKITFHLMGRTGYGRYPRE